MLPSYKSIRLLVNGSSFHFSLWPRSALRLETLLAETSSSSLGLMIPTHVNLVKFQGHWKYLWYLTVRIPVKKFVLVGIVIVLSSVDS